MASTVGQWNPAWGPEPEWQGPAKVAPPKKKYRWYRISCTCSAEEHLVRHPGEPQYECTRCGRAMSVSRVIKQRQYETSMQVGERYGRLVVTEVVRGSGQGVAALCRCDCGNTKRVWARHLREGRTRSCGCLRKDAEAWHPWRSSFK